MNYTVVVDAEGRTITQDTAGGVVIRCMDSAGHSCWRPVVERPQAAETVADTPDRSTPTPEAPEAETEAQARSRRAEIRTQIAAANERRRQAAWEREEAAYQEIEETAEEQEAEAPEDGDRDSKSVWLGPFGSFLGCSVWFFGPPVVFFPLQMLCHHIGWEAGAFGVALAGGLTFWAGYLWFLSWQGKEEKRRALRSRLDAAAGVQQATE